MVMTVSFEWSNLSPLTWIFSLACGMLAGITKAGLMGLNSLVVLIMANLFGGRASTGVVLPINIIADILAVHYYNHHARWKYVVRFMPWILLGIMAGLLVGNFISDDLFKKILAGTVFAGIAVMTRQDIGEQSVTVPEGWWFPMVLGISGGFATMVGNVGGPLMWLYLLAMRLPKYNLIGTASCLFVLVGLSKIPLHVIFWKTVTLKTMAFDLLMAPAIVGGFYFGIRIVRAIPDKPYRILILASTLASTLLLLK
ncbi:MAG: sulfite exporter TauE/SafE family protein [Gemmatimonadota bacterium]|nr:MAG: sulfite exporter TauE/SafE family protein [Gemmatimonadota bacterium]